MNAAALGRGLGWSLGDGFGGVLHQIDQQPGQILAGEAYRLGAAVGLHGQCHRGPGQRRQQIAVGQQLGGQVRNRQSGQQIPVPVPLFHACPVCARARFGAFPGAASGAGRRLRDSLCCRGAARVRGAAQAFGGRQRGPAPGVGLKQALEDAVRNGVGIERHQFFHQAAAGGGDQAQFLGVMRVASSQHAGLLQQIAIERQRRDHIARIVGHFGEGLAPAAQCGEGLDDLFHPPALDAIPGARCLGYCGSRLGSLHTLVPFEGRCQVSGVRCQVSGVSSQFAVPGFLSLEVCLFPVPCSLFPSP